jgi:formyl-CoA transferase
MRCQDGAIVVSAYLEHHWTVFAKAIGAEVLLVDPRFKGASNRVANRTALLALLEHYLASGTASYWQATLQAAGILVGEVKSYAQVVCDPCTVAAHMIEKIDSEFGIRSPIRLSGSRSIQLRRRQEAAPRSAELADKDPTGTA